MSTSKKAKDSLGESRRRAKAVAVMTGASAALDRAETIAGMAQIVITVVDSFGGDEYGMKHVSMHSPRALISIDGAIEEFVAFVDAQGPVRVVTSTHGTVEEFEGRLPEVDLNF